MLGIEHEPAAHAYECAIANELADVSDRPFGVAGANHGRRLDDDRAAAVLSWGGSEPEVPVPELRRGAVTVRRLGPLHLCADEVALDGHRLSFIRRDPPRVAPTPIRAYAPNDAGRPVEVEDLCERRRHPGS